MTQASDIVAYALATIPGALYRLGAEANLNNPDKPKYLDCSEAVEYVCYRTGVAPKMPDGAWQQAAHCRRHGTEISIAEAFTTPGALLFKDYGPAGAGGLGNHVAISLGDGRCVEARSGKLGCGVFNAHNRTPGWNFAARIPGVTYTLLPPLPAPLPPPVIAPIEVKPMYDPPLALHPIVASCDCPTGGAWALANDWSVYTFGSAPFHGHAGGSVHVVGRAPAAIRAITRSDGQPGYECIATSGEVYGMGGFY
jgi:cell wall-associated NlpC family hydrolase